MLTQAARLISFKSSIILRLISSSPTNANTHEEVSFQSKDTEMRNKSKSRPDYSSIDWRNTDKSGQDFRKFNFYRARFEFSILENCNFSAVSAKHSCFIKANLSGSDFTGANLEGANFCGANLTNVIFKSAILSNTNFESAITEGASFINASTKMARKLCLSEAQLQEIEAAKQAQKEANAKIRLAR